jgi:hypothetical protein
MSKSWLLATIGAAVLVVAALAVLTPTVIVDEGDGDTVRAVAVPGTPWVAPAPAVPAVPGQALPQPFGDLRNCLRKHGLGAPNPGAPLDPGTLKDALKSCRGALPGRPGRRFDR